jgi:ABC-type transport system involved in multi-copper enzyme maturation permease subunit
MRGLLVKAVRESWLAAALLGLALLLITLVLNFALPKIEPDLSEILLRMPFVRSMLSALLGIEMGDEVTTLMMQSIVWTHPAVLAALCAHIIIFCTRIPVGEIDRGTIDVLLGLPVSRRTLFVGESVIWVSSGLFLLAMCITGHAIGTRAAEVQPLGLRTTLLVVINLFCLYLAVGGVTYLVSALGERRGRAMAVVFAIVLASFLLTFLAQFWTPADRIAFLSILNYYRPARIIRGDAIPPAHALTLLAVAAVTWLAAGEITARRSICTV